MTLSTAISAAELKIGYVQVDQILKEAPQTAISGKKLEKEFGPKTAELDQLKDKIQAKENNLNKNALTLKESDRRDQERDLEALKIEFQRKQRALREDINSRKNEELSKLQDEINTAVKKVAEAENYDLIVYSGVAYAKAEIDVTDKVLKSLGKK